MQEIEKFKFFFPKNFNITPKLFGVIEYQIIILVLVLNVLIYNILNLFKVNLFIIIQILIIITMPFILFSIIGFNGENFIDVIKYIIKYVFSKKVYLYGED